jgi:hypothetical protein
MAITPGTVTPDGTTPTPAPTDNAPAQAQAPATAPAQPAATAAPAQAPAQTPAQGTTPTPSSPTTQSGMPGIPTADATATAVAHPTSILRGALMGILGAASKVGKGVGHELSIINQGGHVAAANTKIAQAGEIARQQQQAQAAKEASQKAQDEHIAAGDVHNEAPLRMNILSNQMTGLAISNSLQRENLSETQMKNTDMVNAYHARLMQVLRDQGIPMDVEKGVGFDNLGPKEAQDIASNKIVGLSTGQTGENHGLYFIDQAIANRTPLTKDVDVVSDYKVNPKTGDMEEVHSTLRAGQDTVATLLNSVGVQMDKFLEKSKIADQIAKQRTTAADITAKGAETNKSNAEAENQRAQAALFGAGVNPQNMNLAGEDFVKTLPVQMQSIVDALHNYSMDSKDLPRGKEKLPYIAAVTHAYPDWSEPKYQERHDYLKEYGSSTKGDGATRNRLNTAIGHMDALSQASQALSTNDMPALAKIANNLGVAVGRTPKITYDAIALKAAGESAGAIKGGAAAATDAEIENTYKSFNGDQGAAQRQANIDAQFGILNTQVNTVRDGFTNKMGVTPQQFGQPVLYGNTQQVLDRHLGGGGPQIPAGTKPVVVNGKTVGYTTDGKTMTPLQ